TAGVGQELDNAGQQLEGVAYDKAAVSQRTVIRGLKLLLDRIEQTQGLIGTDREALLAMVKELTKKQEAPKNKNQKTEQYEKMVKDLEKAKAEVAEAKAQQDTANAAAKTDPKAAKAPEQSAADKLAKAQEGKELPQAVKSRLNEAEAAAKEAAEKAG